MFAIIHKDLIGKTFGYFTIIKLNHQDSRGCSWVCRCVCGKEVILSTANLTGTPKRNPNRSCGCKYKSQKGNTTKHKRIYSIYKAMIYRCYNPSADNYDRYGAKGVQVCNEWLNDFGTFVNWALNNGYKDGLTIDRIDSQEAYSPDNCRWEDYFTQEANRGLNKNNTTGYKGVTYSEKHGYRAHLMRKGIRKHLGCFSTLEEAVKARENAIKSYEQTGIF